MRDARRENAPAKCSVDWSVHEEKLRKLWAAGKSCGDIAAALGHGITRNAVIGKIHRLKIQGLPRVAGPWERNAKGQMTRAAGRDRPGIAAVPKPKAPLLSKNQTYLARQMLDDGDYTAAEIAEKIGAMALAIQGLARSRKRERAGAADDGLARRRRAARVGFIAPALPQKNMLLAFADGYHGQKGRVALADLEIHHCRFPVDMPDGAVQYCGLEKEERGSYCPAHAVRCCADGMRP